MLELLGGDPEFFEPSCISMPATLEALAIGGVKEVDGCVVPKSFKGDRIWDLTRPNVANIDDETGFECDSSEINVESFLTDAIELHELARLGLEVDFLLSTRLASAKISGPFRVIVNARPEDLELKVGNACTVRFHRLRDGQVWLKDDLEGYPEEAIAVFDITADSAATASSLT
ncbi:MAG: hypothetical protein ACLPY1_17200 [Terracidiphilus sp.]